MTEQTPSPASVAKRSSTTSAQPQLATPAYRHARGEVWFVSADPERPAVGTEIWSNRPAVVLSNNVLNARSGFAVIAYLSTAVKKRSGPTHVEVPALQGKGTAMVLLEQLHTVDASRLQKRLGSISREKLTEIDTAVSLSLGIGRFHDEHSYFRKWEEHLKSNKIDIAKEIEALAGQTADQRVVALTEALKLMTLERDSWRTLHETNARRGDVLDDVARALGGELHT